LGVIVIGALAEVMSKALDLGVGGDGRAAGHDGDCGGRHLGGTGNL
jgi:hypothetical protein